MNIVDCFMVIVPHIQQVIKIHKKHQNIHKINHASSHKIIQKINKKKRDDRNQNKNTAKKNQANEINERSETE